jgi:hypothetical protein
MQTRVQRRAILGLESPFTRREVPLSPAFACNPPEFFGYLQERLAEWRNKGSG